MRALSRSDAEPLSISHFLLCLYGLLPRETVVVTVRPTLRVFIDETSSHDDPSQPLMLTGCVSTLPKWDRLDRKWRTMLAEKGLDHLHWYDLLHGEGKLAGSKVEDRIHLVEQAEGYIFKYVTFGFCTVLSAADFATYRDAKGTSLTSLLDSDYGVSFRVAMGFMHSVLPMAVGGAYPSVYVLVEDGHENSGAANEIFRQYKKQYEGKERIVKQVTLVGKDEFPGTQAADIRGSGFLMQELSAMEKHYQDITPDFKTVAEWNVQKKSENQLPWYRLPLKDGVLLDLRDGLILSKRNFAERYGSLLSKYFWASSFPPKGQSS